MTSLTLDPTINAAAQTWFVHALAADQRANIVQWTKDMDSSIVDYYVKYIYKAPSEKWSTAIDTAGTPPASLPSDTPAIVKWTTAVDIGDFKPQDTPTKWSSEIDAATSGDIFSTGQYLQLGSAFMVMGAMGGIPPLARALALIPLASGGLKTIPGFGRIAGGLGLLGIADDLLEKVGIDLWPDDPAAETLFRDIVTDLEKMVASGLIDVPRTRRDGTESPWNYLTFNLSKNPGDAGWGFLHPNYFSRKTINAAVENALKPATRVSSAPRVRRRTR